VQSSRSAPATTLIKINGKTFVAGLYWQTLHHAVSYVDEAKTLGRENGMAAFAVRKTRLMIQAGYAPAGPVPLRGARSLAAALAHTLGDNWIGVFAIGVDTYALVAVLDGGVMPGRDMVGSFDAIHTILRDTTALIDASNGEKSFNRCIAPAEFGVGEDALALETLLRGVTMNSASRLRPVVFALPEKRALVRAAAGALTVTVVLTAFWVVLENRAREQARKQAVIEQARQEAAGAHTLEVPLEYRAPWESTPGAADTAAACDRAMNLPLSVAGWVFTEATCGVGVARAKYVRRGSTSIGMFRNDAKLLLASDIEASDNGNTATVAVGLGRLEGDVIAPATAFDATITFASYFQQRGIQAQLTEIEGPPLPDIPGAPYAIPWKLYGFTVDSNLAPRQLLAGLHLGGVRINTIEMKLSDGQQPTLSWFIAGDLYVLH
jgi:hypothetical protein